MRVVEDICRDGTAPPRSASRTTTPSARSSGRAARRPSPRSGRISRRTTTSRTASSRARSCRRCCGASRQLSAEHGLRVGNVFHAGDGNLHPLVLYDGARRGRGRARPSCVRRAILERLRRGRRLDHGRARRRRRQGAARCRRCSRRDDLEMMARVRRAFDPDGAREPGQGAADAAPVRRGARAPPHASAREGRRCRASLSRRRSTSSSEVLRAATAAGRRVSVGRPGGDLEVSLAGSTACSRTRPATSRSRSRRASGSRRCAPASRRIGQELALDPPGDPTIGGCLAGDLSGPRRHRFGAPRDLLLGVTLVLADGTVANAGGTVVKNVAGYDLGKLVCGSRGPLRRDRAGRASGCTRCRPPTASVVVDVDEPDGGRAARSARIARSGADPDRLRARVAGPPAAALRGGRGRASRPRSRARRSSSAHTRSTTSSGTRCASVQASLPGRISYAPGALAALLAGADRARAHRRRLGATSPTSPTDARSPGAQRLAERVREALDPLEVLA